MGVLVVAGVVLDVDVDVLVVVVLDDLEIVFQFGIRFGDQR